MSGERDQIVASSGNGDDPHSDSVRTAARAIAALNILESLLLVLVEKGVVSAEDLSGLIEDAEAASRPDPSTQAVVAEEASRLAEAITHQMLLAGHPGPGGASRDGDGNGRDESDGDGRE